MLFKNYPSLNYTLNGKTVTVLDIFRNVVFTNVETSTAFDDYYIQDGETPENISAKLYGTTSLSWLIMLVNNKVHIKDDWFLSQAEEKTRQESLYGGDAYYIAALPDLLTGDIMVKVTGTGPYEATSVDLTVYRHIAEFDPYFRKVRGICGSGTFSSGDTVLFARQNKQNGTVSPITFIDTTQDENITDYTTILYAEDNENSPLYFYNASDVIIDGYRTSPTNTTSVAPKTTYFDPSDTLTENNFALTMIYRYGLCGGIPPYGLYEKTIAEDENDKYLEKQKIKILKPEYVKVVTSTIETALETNIVGNRIKIEL
jgi:hypothetical protein